MNPSIDAQSKENVPLADKTTFKIGGNAASFVTARSREELITFVEFARMNQQKFVILAGGSNVLVPDEGIANLVIKIEMKEYRFQDDLLSADSGCVLLDLIREAARQNLGGWEKLAGIPGTLGGAVRGNAGAFGSEIKDFVESVDVLNSATLELETFINEKCDFSYRHSFFKDHPEIIILAVTLRLQRTLREESTAAIEDTIAERERRHLQNVCAAGSYFMNPVVSAEIQRMFETEKGAESREGRVPAGWLIERAGMKGAQVGGAIASLQHPNYIVNTSNATARDVRQLAENIKKAVYEKFKVQLTEEAVVL